MKLCLTLTTILLLHCKHSVFGDDEADTTKQNVETDDITSTPSNFPETTISGKDDLEIVFPGLVPDILEKYPDERANVKYRNAEVSFGNELTPTQVQEEPILTWKSDPTKFYLMVMIDPDASQRSFNHWMVGNIPGIMVSKGDVLAEYIGAGPPKGTGLHRYAFYVYEQLRKFDFDEPRLNATTNIHLRVDFKPEVLSDKYNLGRPYAVNFFVAQWDEYVDTLYASFQLPVNAHKHDEPEAKKKQAEPVFKIQQ